MKQYIDKDRILAEIERRKNQFVSQAESFHKIGMEDKESYYAALASNMNSLSCFLDTLEVKEVDEEPVSKDLKAEFVLYLKHKFNIPQEGNKLKTNGWNPSPYDLLDIAKHFAQWQKENLWKDAQGDDLPEIDREVIVLYQPYPCEGNEYAVSFGHRPPERWCSRNLDGEEHVFEPKTYDKGEWNIPNVVWWLDLDLPIKGE